MINKNSLPYGNTNITFELDESFETDLYLPPVVHANHDELSIINTAIRNPLNNVEIPLSTNSNTKVAITINDKTRPVPNNKLFPPLLGVLQSIGIKRENILILVATGTHLPMPASEFPLLLNNALLKKYKVISHDCDDNANLTYKGTTSRNTPIFVNSLFDQADIKIVVGDIEPHHFAGFSGGAKSAAIGVCGRKTINQNHSLLQDPKSSVGRFEDNPLRQDIEEIGQLIGVNFALNAILNEKKEILHVFFGSPKDVIEAGIKIIRATEITQIDEPYDLVIASAGGYPKDINLYQAQKALTHASLFSKDGGTVLLAAACYEGVGSQSYLDSMAGISNHAEARARFIEKGFSVGPHKAFQFAVIADRVNFQIKSEIDPSIMKKLLITPIMDLQETIQKTIESFPTPPRIAVLPYATATIPQVRGDKYGN